MIDINGWIYKTWLHLVFTTQRCHLRYKHFDNSNSNDDYLQGVVDHFSPIFVTDIATIYTRTAPAIFAALLGITVDEFESVSGATKNKEKSKAENKLTKEQEYEIVKTVGATQIYARLEREIQQRSKQN